ncbi:MAG: sporulation initiation factor Spo0A C-terminal domain-containing protein [Ruminococcus sp.]|nr:sporulation initiation factor Spo0A C-terminal domain-containing protein [Ruminococcus sp.]
MLSKDIEKEITDLLMILGIAPNLKGFHYLRKAIGTYVLAVENDLDVLRNIYDTVALEFDSTRAGAERSMRHAIISGWKRRDRKFASEIFGNCLDYKEDEFPSNQLFVSATGEWIKQHCAEGETLTNNG